MTVNLKNWDVYLVTDRDLAGTWTILDIVDAAIAGRISVVQLREKNLSTRDFLQEGLKIRYSLKSAGIPLIINDRIDIALALDADGVHLGQNDMPLSIARRLLPGKIIGLSVESPSDINEEAQKYADYLAVSPVFVTATKPDASRPWGLEGLAQARKMTRLPLIAIGGISKDNAQTVFSSGADCIATVGAIVAAPNPELATRELVEEARKAKIKK